jgi:hypothetical protein
MISILISTMVVIWYLNSKGADVNNTTATNAVSLADATPVVAPATKSIFDILPARSELLATNATSLVKPEAVAPPDANAFLLTNLTNYFKIIWPYMPIQSFDVYKNLYPKLDCWYLNFIPGMEIPNGNLIYTVDRLPELTSLEADLKFSRLFDGSVCDCVRLNLPNCKFSLDRLSSKGLPTCSLWPGIASIVTPSWLLNRAFNSNNPDGNFMKDTIVRPGFSGKKGFPNFSYYEGIVYPGEYGITEFCKPTASQDVYWTQNQKGIKTDGKVLAIKNSSSPWYNEKDCENKDCQSDLFLPSNYKCITIDNDGSGGVPTGTFKRCLRDTSYTIENFSTELATDCPSPGFPEKLCQDVSPLDYRGFWTYPQVGCGLWRTVGKSIVVNTKLGWLIGPKENGGCDLDFNQLLTIRGSTNAFEQNLVQQVNRVQDIIKSGSVTSTTNWPAMTISTLQSHGYKGTRITNATDARKAAIDLVKFWYIEGYTGLDKGIVNGFNYNYKKYFPIGCHFSYASRFDNIMLSMLTTKGLDSIQLLLEPQNVVAGLRPAYMFEIFSKKPTTTKGLQDSAFQDTRTTQCKSVFSLDPSRDLANFMKYGYIPKDLAILNPLNLDVFKARMATISFQPIK